MRTIRKKCDSYLELLPENASEVQVKETEMAFYAGAAAILSIMIDIASDDVSDEAGEAILQSLHDETVSYADSLSIFPNQTDDVHLGV